MNEEDMRRQLGRLLHELQNPVVAIRCAIEFTRRELASKNVTLSPDYLDDAWHYSELLSTMLRNAALLRDADRPITPNRSRSISFLSGVLYPAIQSVELLLRKREQTRSAITLHNVDVIPPLYVDPKQMHLVFYNLLSNAIKYSRGSDLRIQIAASATENSWLVAFRNWGIGIDPAESENLFREGFRGRKALSHDVTGNGLGLYVCRSILESHESEIHLTNSSNPTEFTISLPRSLAERGSE